MTPERVRVVQLGGGPALWFCSWMFAEHGDQVTVVRRHEGAARLLDEWSLSYLRERLTVLEAGQVDESTLAALVAEADVITGAPEEDWSRADLAGKVTGTVDSVGPTRTAWADSELVLSALGGAADYTRDPTGRPVYGFGDRYQYLAGLQLHSALLAELLSEGATATTAPAPRLRVSVLETVTWNLPYPTTQVQFNGSTSNTEQSGPRYVCACSDGWVAIYAGRAWADLAALLGDLVDPGDPRFVEVTDRFDHAPVLGQLLERWCAPRTVAEAVSVGAAHDVAVTCIAEPADIVAQNRTAGEPTLPRLPVRSLDRVGAFS
jgi:hypothetical protein